MAGAEARTNLSGDIFAGGYRSLLYRPVSPNQSGLARCARLVFGRQCETIRYLSGLDEFIHEGVEHLSRLGLDGAWRGSLRPGRKDSSVYPGRAHVCRAMVL